MSESAPRLDSGSRSTRVRFSVMAFLCVLSFLTYYDRQCIVRAQENIQQALSISDSQMGLVFGAFWLAYALFEIPGGWMGDKIGARFTLTRIVLAWSLFTALTGSATGFYSLIVYRFLFGVGEAGAYPNMARIQSRWLPQIERAQFGGLLWLTARWGAAFAPLIFGTMTRGIDSVQAKFVDVPALRWLAETPSWRIGFFVAGLLGVVWCLAFYPWFRDDPAQKSSVSPDELRYIEKGRPKIESGHHMEARMWGKLFASPMLWAIALYYICGSFGWSFFVSWMPKFMKEVHHVSFEKSEWSTGLPMFCGGISCLLGGVLSDALVKLTGWKRLGRAIFPIVGCLTAAAAMFAIPHVKSQHQAVILMCVAAAAFDFGQAATWASIVDIGGRYAGTATGFINMVGNLGNATQPYIGARVFTTFGWSTLFGVYAVAFLLAMSMWTIINPVRCFYDGPKSKDEPPEIVPVD
jgi:MFS transporter, ACS family, glucarate transporter